MFNDDVAAIIVAAGVGTRMGSSDKVFAVLGDRPLLAHTLASFQACPAVRRIVLVLAAEKSDRRRQLVADYGLHKVTATCTGGPRRQDSVRCGLDALGECHWVVVHDGARPLVSADIIQRGLEAARATGAAVAAMPVVDTIKRSDGDVRALRTLDRSTLWAIQTPQVFRYDLLRRAHDEVTADVTDDAAMLEALGLPVSLFPGSRLSVKITTPEDLQLAEALLQLRPVVPQT